MRNLIKYCILAMGLVGSNYPMKADVMTVARSFSSHNLNHHTMQEIFKDITGYENKYQVSNLGNVKSLSRTIWNGKGYYNTKDKLLNPTLTKRGYYTVALCNNSYKRITVHQLVAMAFLNHKPNGMKLVVDHINNDTLNNCVTNLQIITHRKNCSKDKKGFSSKYIGVFWCKPLNKWASQIRINKKGIHLGYFKTEYEAHIAYQNELKTIS